jgi:ribosomal 50S subunit-recycling heat shock protein
LKQSRLVKRRSLARELCEEGAVLVNGRTARAGRDVAPGDEITLRLRNRLLAVAVSELPERTAPASRARELYRLIRDERRGEEESESESEGESDATAQAD